MQTLVVLPVYNEEDNLKELIPQLLDLEGYLKILIVDDCSVDKSLQVAERFRKEYSDRIFVISQSKHLGRGNAVKQGYKFTLENNFDYLIEMDADLSHRPEYIPLLIKESPDVDMVIGSRLIQGASIHGRPSFFRNTITYIANIYLRFILGLRTIKDLTSGFRCINLKFLCKINLHLLKSYGPQLLQEIIFKNRHNICIKEIPITFWERRKGKTKFSLYIILKSIYLPLYWRVKDCI